MWLEKNIYRMCQRQSRLLMCECRVETLWEFFQNCFGGFCLWEHLTLKWPFHAVSRKVVCCLFLLPQTLHLFQAHLQAQVWTKIVKLKAEARIQNFLLSTSTSPATCNSYSINLFLECFGQKFISSKWLNYIYTWSIQLKYFCNLM